MSSISLDNAWLLLIALPLIILIAVPFFITVRKDNRNGHNIASGVLHIVMAIIVAFAAAGVTLETTLTETDVYVVADISYSSNRNLDQIDEYINDLQDKLPDNSQLGVVCFGKNYAINTRLGEEFDSVKNSLDVIDDSQTDIVSALKATGSIFKADVIKRIVLITDAKQTGVNGDSEFYDIVNSLYANNVYVDAIYLDNNISGDLPEVQLTGVEYSQVTYKGQDASASVTLQSTQETAATVSLYRTETDDVTLEVTETLAEQKSVTLNAGTTTVDFTLASDREEGIYSYTVKVVSDNDFNPYNNSGSFTQEVEGSVQVLIVTASYDDFLSAGESFAGSDVKVSVYCSDYTIPDGISGICEYEVLSSLPYTVVDLCKYDIVMLADIDVSTLSNYTMFIDSLDVCVSQLGKSLIGVGDLNLQNNDGDEYLQKLSDMLPVNYGNDISDNNLYILVIDCSHSMMQAGKLSRAQNVASSIVKLLDEDDNICIIKFHGNSEIVLAASSKVGDGSEALEVIENITTKQGTVVSGGLNAVYNSGAINIDANKSMILITDGATNSSDMDGTYTAVQILNEDYGITTSVVDVNHYDTSVDFLQKVATLGGGSYNKYDYSIQLDDILPEIANELGDSVVDGGYNLVNVDFANSSDSVLDGLREEGIITTGKYTLLFVEGYLVSSAKTGATTVLKTTYEDEDVPIYSYWNYGNGRSACFTSTLSGNWVDYWKSNNILQILFADILDTNIPGERVDTPYTVSVSKDGDSCSVEINPVEVTTGVTVSVTVTPPSGDAQELSVVYNSSAYVCSFDFDTVGTYKISVDYEYKGTISSYDYYIDVSFLSEYDSFTTYSASLLYRVIGSDGTVSEDGAFEIVNDSDIVSKRTVSFTAPLLIAAVVLFAVDIIIRKLKWNDIVSLFRKVDRGRKS